MPEQHIRFQKVDIEHSRHKPIRVIKKPERDHVQHGDELEIKVAELQRAFTQSTLQQPPEFDPALIFKLKIEGYVDENEWRRSGLTILSEQPDGLDF